MADWKNVVVRFREDTAERLDFGANPVAAMRLVKWLERHIDGRTLLEVETRHLGTAGDGAFRLRFLGDGEQRNRPCRRYALIFDEAWRVVFGVDAAGADFERFGRFDET